MSARKTTQKKAQKPAKPGAKKCDNPVPVSPTKSKHRAYAEGILAGKTKARAARDAGFAPSTAYNAKQKLDHHPDVQALFASMLEKAGVTQDLLAQRMFEGLNAVETKFFLRRWPLPTTRDKDPAARTLDGVHALRRGEGSDGVAEICNRKLFVCRPDDIGKIVSLERTRK